VEIADGIAEGVCVGDGDGLAGLHLVHVNAEDDLGFVGEADLVAWFRGGIGGEQEEKAAVKGRDTTFFWKRNRKLRSLRARGDRANETEEANDQRASSKGTKLTAHEGSGN